MKYLALKGRVSAGGRIKKRILESGRIHIDESPVDIFDSPKVRQRYMWVLIRGVGADPPYHSYDFYENRKHENTTEILGSYSGIIHSGKVVSSRAN